MRGLGTGLALLAVFGWSTATLAATVNVNSGTVSINGGKPTASSAPAKAGDSVSAGPKGDATIVYGNGCTQRVEAGTTVSVLTDEQCALAQGGPQGGPQGGGLAGIGGTGLAIGAVAVAVGVGIAASQNKGSSNNRAASP